MPHTAVCVGLLHKTPAGYADVWICKKTKRRKVQQIWVYVPVLMNYSEKLQEKRMMQK